MHSSLDTNLLNHAPESYNAPQLAQATAWRDHGERQVKARRAFVGFHGAMLRPFE